MGRFCHQSAYAGGGGTVTLHCQFGHSKVTSFRFSCLVSTGFSYLSRFFIVIDATSYGVGGVPGYW